MIALKLVAGVLVVLIALWESQFFAGPVERYGYVPVMFVFMVVMMVGGGLMASGVMGVWSRVFRSQSR